MKLDRARSCLAVAVAAAVASVIGGVGCAAPAAARAPQISPPFSPQSEVGATTTLTSAFSASATNANGDGKQVLTGKVQRAGADADGASGAVDEGSLSAAPKGSTADVRPSDRRDASRRGGFGASWK
jgi:hypothetical protein